MTSQINNIYIHTCVLNMYFMPDNGPWEGQNMEHYWQINKELFYSTAYWNVTKQRDEQH